MKMILSVLNSLLLISTLYSCNSDKTPSRINIDEVIHSDSLNNLISLNHDFTEINDALDLLLSCAEYGYFEIDYGNLGDFTPPKSYFRMPYNGCLYNPSTNPNNKSGLADVILIPKQSYKNDLTNIDSDKIDSIEKIVNKMDQEKLKEKFIPIIFLIDKKYLHYIENVEINYYPELPYRLKMFIYKDDLKKWSLVDSTEIYNEADNSKWTDSKLVEKLRNE